MNDNSEHEEIELKHCPFCGKGNSVVELYIDQHKFWKIGCGACGTHSGISKNKDQVIRLWNNRPNGD